MSRLPYHSMTPWVWRLIIANAVVLLLLMTLTPALAGSLAFDPRQPFTEPWTYISYMFVHGSLWHLAVNMLLLFFWGTPLEERMGSRVFLLFYLYCGLGGPLLSLLVSAVGVPVAPFVGASAAVLGIGVAYTMYWPDAEMIIFPLPVPIKTRYIVIGIISLDFLAAMLGANSMVAHWAHLGGALVGFIYMRVQSYSRPVPIPRSIIRERVLVSRPQPAEAAVEQTPKPRPRHRGEKDLVTVEMDRVLDKISAQGMDSLTPAERQFLSDVSAKRKKDS
ncbi:MAG: rhomboid family intramembrane serine protease [Gemmatimonadetes bacterium]|nr:rhomboid family intramembrane serine protease [Gemmatimonadota bacterium]